MPFGTRCEIKNINSVRFLQAAIGKQIQLSRLLLTDKIPESERLRHIAHYCTSPLEPLAQETRGFNELTLQTYSLRSKEEATDYRYMPDHNLPAIIIDDVSLTIL